jgi:hypothetical protein
VQRSRVYEAEDADLDGARVDADGRSVTVHRGQSATSWVYAATDGYADLSYRHRNGTPHLTVNGEQAGSGRTVPDGKGWFTTTTRVYLRGGVDKVVSAGETVLDRLTVTPVPNASGAVTYQAENAALTGTAHVDTSYSQAHGGVVTGVGNGPANALTFSVRAPHAGHYAMTVRFANDTELEATHYNPDTMTAPADISVNGGPSKHFNFANTFNWNQFWTVHDPGRPENRRQHDHVRRQSAVQLGRQDRRRDLLRKQRGRRAVAVRDSPEPRRDHRRCADELTSRSARDGQSRTASTASSSSAGSGWRLISTRPSSAESNRSGAVRTHCPDPMQTSRSAVSSLTIRPGTRRARRSPRRT